MPIKPENRHRYPENWPEIRTRILARAGGRCEQSGVSNRDTIVRGIDEDAATFQRLEVDSEALHWHHLSEKHLMCDSDDAVATMHVSCVHRSQTKAPSRIGTYRVIHASPNNATIATMIIAHIGVKFRMLDPRCEFRRIVARRRLAAVLTHH